MKTSFCYIGLEEGTPELNYEKATFLIQKSFLLELKESGTLTELQYSHAEEMLSQQYKKVELC